MYKIGILNLGCPRNLVDAENILGRLKRKGYRIVDMEKADVAIVNTCAFIEEAKQESINAILDLAGLKKEGRLKKIIVAGCLSQRYRDELRKELPEVDAFTGAAALNHGLSRFAITPRHYAYLKICESCLNNCSYCVIPKIKGRFSSLDIDAVLKRVEMLRDSGISELNIIGQDITAYGADIYGRKMLPELLRRIVKKAKRIGWIRLLYLYPDSIVNELLEIIAAEPKVCKYIDLPVQHINDRILKLMHRRPAKKDILGLIDKIRKKIPAAAIRTSVIVGFPSETEEEFAGLLEFINDVKFDRLGAFTYSREEGTPAYDFSGQIPEKVKLERFNRIMSAQKLVSEENNRKFLGKTLVCLIDEKAKGHYLARSQYDAPEVDGTVYVKSSRRLKAGEFVKVKITDTLDYDLVGEDVK
ncbi:MAG: 30S ribosomal protein S12 methylthiotransferase RimO [Candidatus Omnitrophota bacterium]